MLTVLAAVAEFERDLIKDRTKLGLARAHAAGKTLGRPRAAGKTLGRPRVTVDQVLAEHLRASGASYASIAPQLGVSVGKVHGALNGPGLLQKSDPTPNRPGSRDRGRAAGA